MVISFPGEASTAIFSLAGAFLDLLLRGLTLRDHVAVGWLSGFLGLRLYGAFLWLCGPGIITDVVLLGSRRLVY